MNTSEQSEWHPWLKLFTILAIFPGSCLWFIMGVTGGGRTSSLFWLLFTATIFPVMMIIAAIYTLRVTDYFRRWNYGISKRDRAIGQFPIIIGIMVAIALFFVAPFMRFITDLIGGGRHN